MGKPSSRRGQSRNEQNTRALNELFHQARVYKRSEDYRELLDFVKNFPNIAPYNAMLVHIQRPGSRYVANARVWMEEYGRKIRPGARPLIILHTFGPVDFVYDISDTVGPDLPDAVLNPFRVDDAIAPELLRRLCHNINRDGILLQKIDFGSRLAGRIARLREAEKVRLPDGILTYYYHVDINACHNPTEQFCTLTHELGHLYLGHLGRPFEKWWPDRQGLDERVVEFEAESVSWLLCERLGLPNRSAEYLSGYLGSHEEVPNIDLDGIFRVVNQIESMTQRILPRRKENFEPWAKR